jgi:hypothetical protein
MYHDCNPSTPIMGTALDQAMATMVTQALQSLGAGITADPIGTAGAMGDFIRNLLGKPHTGYDCIQDLWDAVEDGALSHSAAVQATVILAADLERRGQRPADQPIPRPHTQPKPAELAPTSPLDVIRRMAEYQALQRN